MNIQTLAAKPYNHDTAHDDISDQDILDYATEIRGLNITDELETAILAAGQQPLTGQVETCGDAMEAIIDRAQA